MRKIALAAAAAMLIAAAPAAAQEEPVPTAPCEAPEEGAVLTTEGAAEDMLPPLVPSAAHHEVGQAYPPGSVTEYRYRLDVSGSEEVPTATTGKVGITLDWDTDGDYDLYVTNATTGASMGESTAFNPLDGAGENVTVQVAHCTDILIEIVNYAAVASDMTLTTSVTGLK